jgi:hypothetical protein
MVTDETKLDSEPAGIMKQKLTHNIHNKPTDKNDLDALCKELIFSEEEITNINDITLNQWQCKEWYGNKAGFITASKCKKIFTRQKTLEKHANDKHDVSRIVKEIVHPTMPMPSKQVNSEPQTPRDWGLFHEDSARDAYFRVERHKHSKIQLQRLGFLISNKKPFLGASLDNIRQCSDDCLPVVIEYKCPWKHKELHPKQAFLSKEVGGVEVEKELILSPTSQYYFQVQLQMFVANLLLCDLVVWTKKGIFTCQIKFNAKFVTRVVEKLEAFWKKHVLSYMVSQVVENNKESSEKKSGIENYLYSF